MIVEAKHHEKDGAHHYCVVIQSVHANIYCILEFDKTIGELCLFYPDIVCTVFGKEHGLGKLLCFC